MPRDNGKDQRTHNHVHDIELSACITKISVARTTVKIKSNHIASEATNKKPAHCLKLRGAYSKIFAGRMKLVNLFEFIAKSSYWPEKKMDILICITVSPCSNRVFFMAFQFTPRGKLCFF